MLPSSARYMVASFPLGIVLMFMCCTKYSSVINLIYSGQDIFSYNIVRYKLFINFCIRWSEKMSKIVRLKNPVQEHFKSALSWFLNLLQILNFEFWCDLRQQKRIAKSRMEMRLKSWTGDFVLQLNWISMQDWSP